MEYILTVAFITFVFYQLISCFTEEKDTVDGLTAKSQELGLLKEEDPMIRFKREVEKLKNSNR